MEQFMAGKSGLEIKRKIAISKTTAELINLVTPFQNPRKAYLYLDKENPLENTIVQKIFIERFEKKQELTVSFSQNPEIGLIENDFSITFDLSNDQNTDRLTLKKVETIGYTRPFPTFKKTFGRSRVKDKQILPFLQTAKQCLEELNLFNDSIGQ